MQAKMEYTPLSATNSDDAAIFRVSVQIAAIWGKSAGMTVTALPATALRTSRIDNGFIRLRKTRQKDEG